MPRASYRVLHKLFEEHLHFTPTPADVERFEADLAVVSPSLMKASLMELGARRSRIPVGGGAWRDAIFAIYNRKVAEHAQLFPVFHCFETAFRSKVAVTLEEHYRIPRWWYPVHNQNPGDPIVTTIGVVNGVSSDQVRSISVMVNYVSTSLFLDVGSFQDGYELLEHSTLSQVRRLMMSHWSLFSGSFRMGRQPMGRKAFKDKFERIERARNKVYHHQSFGGMTEVYDTADELLGCIGFSLGNVHRRINQANCSRPPYL